MKQWQQYFLFYLSLIYLAFPIYSIVQYERSFVFLGWIAVIAISYVYLIHGTHQVRLNIAWVILIMTIVYLVFAFSPFNAFSFWYVGSLLTFHFRESYRSFKSVTFVIAWCVLFSSVCFMRLPIEMLLFILLPLIFMMGQWGYGLYERFRKQTEQQLSQQAQRINVLIAENERNRIGRDLHDTLGHVFATLVLKSELALKYGEKERYEDVMREVSELKSVAHHAMRDVRTVIESLKYPTIEQEVMSLQEVMAMSNIQCEIEVDCDTSVVAPNIQSQVVMLLREATNNVIKHSRATQYRIRLHIQSEVIVLDIEDDGRGFTRGSSASILKSLNERVASINGKVTIERYANPTHIRVVVPYTLVKEYEDERIIS